MTVLIDAMNLTDQALLDYDDMMTEATSKVEKFAPVAVEIWKEVLREMDNRGMVELISGSYEDLGNALTRRVKRS